MEKLYNLFVVTYFFCIRIASIFSTKAKLWVEGRNDLFQKLEPMDFEKGNWVWFHCASLGEFEQGRPLIEELKENNGYRIMLTFFSPSGFEIRKDYHFADIVSYMPLDTRKNAFHFIDKINPVMAIFIKYEFWYNHLHELNKRKIPTYLISANFRKKQVFFQPLIGTWFRKMLCFFDTIFVINAYSEKLLNDYKIDAVKIIGDTRIDRVLEIKGEDYINESIVRFKGKQLLLIAGSTWKDDEAIILNWYNKNKGKLKLIIAPHEVDAKNINRLLLFINSLSNNLIISKLSESIKEESDVLIIDSIGVLSKIYRYADIAYLGGGLNKGIHNVLEPAVYGIPIIFGWNHRKFPEAIDLINEKGAFSFKNGKEFGYIISNLLTNKKQRLDSGTAAAFYVEKNSGNISKIIKSILPRI